MSGIFFWHLFLNGTDEKFVGLRILKQDVLIVGVGDHKARFHGSEPLVP